MNTLMRPAEFALQINKSHNIFNVQAYQYKKENGIYPKWFLHNKVRNETRINTVLYLNSVELPHEISFYATTHLYWMLRATNHSDKEIAELMFKKSEHFKEFGSWQQFIYKGLFAVNGFQMITKPTMMTEFVRIGTKHLYLLKRWNKLDLTKQEEYYD